MLPTSRQIGRGLLSPHLRQMRDALRAARDAVERAGEALKDTVLDWSIPEDEAGPVAAEPLPPLEREDFVAGLRARVEEALRQVADEINQAPAGPDVAAGEERVLALFEELGREALALGLALRIEAAVSALPPDRQARGRWAEKYRFMEAAEGRWPAPGPGPEDVEG